MNKCFITKLPSSVDNDNLPVLGQLRINWLKQNDLTNNGERAIVLKTNDNITVKVSGAHFTDSTLTSNLGNAKTITATNGDVLLYISNDADAVLTIDNKYSLTRFDVAYLLNSTNTRPIYLDINDLSYCTHLTNLSLAYTQASGDIRALSKLTKLEVLNLEVSQINGDISALSNMTNMNYLILGNTRITGDISALSNMSVIHQIKLLNSQVSGDISALSKLTTCASIGLANTQVSGDISALSNLVNLTGLMLDNTQLSGHIDSLANLTRLSNLASLKGLSLTGDMSKIPVNIRFISQIARKINTNFTWTARGRQNATLLAMENVPFDTTSMDNMLIDQATCTVSPNATNSFEKIISVKGTRTSASDAAVATIQSKGITITGVTKQA